MSQVSSLGTLLNFINNTRQARVTEASRITNLLMAQNRLLDHLKRGDKGGIKTVSSIGTEFRDTVKMRPFSNFQDWSPGDNLTASAGDEDVPIIAPHRIVLANRKVNEFHVKANIGTAPTYTQFKNYRDSTATGLWSDFVNGLNGRLWTRPDSARMENRNAGPNLLQYSVPVFITESGRRPPGWTAGILTADPTLDTRFQNAVAQYDSAQYADPVRGIVAAFDKIVRLTRFFQPSIKPEVIGQSPDTMEYKQIWSTGSGVDKITQLIRQNVASMGAMGFDIAIKEPRFHGIPIRWEPLLDELLLDETGAVPGVSEGSYTDAVYPPDRPRYFFVDTTELKVVTGDGLWLDERTEKGGAINWDSFVWIVFAVANMMCWDRRKLGIVTPL